MASGKWKYLAEECGLAVRRQTGQGRIPEDQISQLLLLMAGGIPVKASYLRIFRYIHKNGPPYWSAIFVLKFVGRYSMEHTGFEPVTSTLPVWRAPSCANAPTLVDNTINPDENQVLFF